MVKERARLVYRLLFFSDVFTTILSFILACWACQVFISDELEGILPFSQYLQLIPIIGLVWAFFLHFFQTYKCYRTLSLLREFWDLFKVTLCNGLLLICFLFAFRYYLVSRALIGTLLSMIILSPILLASAIAMKADPSGPIVFSQKRVGLNGRAFAFHQFRFMVTGAKRFATVLKTSMR